MEVIDYVLIGGLVGGLVGIIAYLTQRKKSGKGGCGCGCQNCPSAGVCHGEQKTDEEKSDDQTV